MPHKISAIALAILCMASANALAEPCDPQFEAGVWTENNISIVGAEVAINTCSELFSSLRLGLTYFTDGESLYQGLTGAFRFRYESAITPFIGLGVLGGNAKHEVPADNDGKDNDGDGLVDEPGEEITINETSAFLYPEAGVSFYSGRFGVTLSVRQYYGVEITSDVIYSLGFNFR